jgi:hypothetical protein
MFGYPAAFVNGNMFTGLHTTNWIVRLPEDGIRELTAMGAVPFEPMPGRAMKGYAALPLSVMEDDAAVRGWVDRALAHASSLPPKKGR